MAVPRHAYVYLTILFYTRVGCHTYIQVSIIPANHHNSQLPLLQGLYANTFLALGDLWLHEQREIQHPGMLCQFAGSLMIVNTTVDHKHHESLMTILSRCAHSA